MAQTASSNTSHCSHRESTSAWRSLPPYRAGYMDIHVAYCTARLVFFVRVRDSLRRTEFSISVFFTRPRRSTDRRCLVKRMQVLWPRDAMHACLRGRLFDPMVFDSSCDSVPNRGNIRVDFDEQKLLGPTSRWCMASRNWCYPVMAGRGRDVT